MTDDDFLKVFESQQLPLDRWHHREHVKVAYLYLIKYSFDEAINRVRNAIKAHNAANQIPEAIDRGYHETMTVAWMRLVQFAIQSSGEADNADAFYDQHPELWQMKVLRFFYSKERFMTQEAKEKFIEPDITPLPIIN